MGKKKKIAAAVLAFTGTCGVGASISIAGNNWLLSANLLLLPFLYVLYQAYAVCFQQKESGRFYLFTGILSVLYSILLIWGGAIDQETEFSYQEVCATACLLTAIYPLVSVFTVWLDHRRNDYHKTSDSRRILYGAFLVVIIFWLLAYLAMFPGVLATDAVYWFYEFATEEVPVTARFSPFYTAVFYGLVVLGKSLFGSANAGFALFSFVQMVFVLAVVWQILLFLYTYFHGKAVILAAAFFALIPTHVIMALSSAQDPVFAACFAICAMHLFRFAQDPHAYFQTKKQPVALVLWLIVLCLVRNNGLYALLVMGVLAAIFVRAYKKQLLLMLACTAVCVSICQGPVYRMLGIEVNEVTIATMLSLPVQQMAYAYNYGQDKLSAETIEQMRTYAPDEAWHMQEVCKSIIDPISHALDQEKITDDAGAFLKLYLRVFLEAPKECMRGAGLQTFGLWYPNKAYPDGRIWHPWIEYLCLDVNDLEYGLREFTIKRTSLFPLYDHLLGKLYGTGDYYERGYGGGLAMSFSSIPVLGLLSKAGIYFWLMMYLFFYALYRGWREPFACIGLLVGLFATVFLGPVMMYRYCAPAIFSAPVFVALMFAQGDGN